MTADTYTSTLGVLLMGTGNDNNSWGGNANSAVFQIFEDAIANVLTSAVTGGTLDLSGTPPPSAASQVRYAALVFTGVLTSSQILKVPNLTKFWWVQNQTSGAYTLTVQTPSGSASTAIPQNSGWQLVSCDGNNNIVVSPFNSAQVQMPNGTLAAPAYSFINEPSSGWRRAGTQDYRFVVNSADVLQITGAGSSGSSITVNVIAGALQVAGVPTGTGTVSTSGSPTAGHLATFASGTIIQDGGVAGTFANRNNLLYGDASAGSINASNLAAGAAPLPYVAAQVADNLHLSNDGSNATRDIDITAGRVRDDSDATNLQLAATMVKRLDTSWAAGGVSGSPAGGCDTSSKGNNQTWHAFVIGNLGQSIVNYARSGTTVTLTCTGHGFGVGSTARVLGINNAANSVSGFDGVYALGSVTTNTISYTSLVSGTVSTTGAPVNATVDGFDTIFSQSYSSPSLPSGWTVKQCLGSVLTDGSANILAFKQVGNEFVLGTALTNTASIGTSASTVSAGSSTQPGPLGIQVVARMRGGVSGLTSTGGSSLFLLVSSPDETDQSPSQNNSTLVAFNNGSFGYGQQGEFQVRTNTSAQVRMRFANSGTTVDWALVGWFDPRRRLF
jgi:hypothetical protein